MVQISDIFERWREEIITENLQAAHLLILIFLAVILSVEAVLITSHIQQATMLSAIICFTNVN